MASDPVRPVVLHIAADFKCSHNPGGTTAIPELIECTSDLAEHLVVSIRRTANPLKICLRRGRDVHWEFTYFGLPYGIFIGSCLRIAAKALLQAAGQDFARAAIIHAHKLSCEALIAIHCMRPEQRLAVSVRGNSDVKVARFHPLARAMMRKALLRARSVLWVSAWAQPAFQAMALQCHPEAAVTLFPNTVDIAPPQGHATRCSSGGCGICTILRLDHYRLKGLPQLLSALAQARRSGCDLRLDIIGGGSTRAVERITALIAAQGLTSAASLVGPLPRAAVQVRLASYDGMVLPSRSETFGLAYLEALCAGIPVVYSLGTGIDGYLPPDCGAIGVHADSVPSITTALLRLATDREVLKSQATAYWKEAGQAYFSRSQLRTRYASNVIRSPSESSRPRVT